MKKYIFIPLVAILWAVVWTVTGGSKASADELCFMQEIQIEEVTHYGVREVEKSKEIQIPGQQEINHQEFQYKRIEPAVPEIKEYRWHRTYTGPKVIIGFSYVNGQWTSTPGTNGAVPDSLNPPSNLVSGQSGTFSGNNKPYGLPNNPNQIGWSYGAGGEEWWPSEDGWATSLSGAPQGAWGNPVANRVQPGTGTSAYAMFYLPGGGESDTLTDDNWTVDTPGDPWVQINERTVIDQEAVPPSTKIKTWTVQEEYEWIENVEVLVDVEVPCPPVYTTVPTIDPPVCPPETYPVDSNNSECLDVDPCLLENGDLVKDGFKLGKGDDNDKNGTTLWHVDECHVEMDNPPTTTVAPTTVPPTTVATVQELPATGSTATGVILLISLGTILLGSVLYALARPNKK